MKRKGKRWRKKGGGILILGNGKKVKPGEIFWAEEEEIRPSFRDVVEELPLPKEEKPKKPKAETVSKPKKSE